MGLVKNILSVGVITYAIFLVVYAYVGVHSSAEAALKTAVIFFSILLIIGVVKSLWVILIGSLFVFAYIIYTCVMDLWSLKTSSPQIQLQDPISFYVYLGETWCDLLEDNFTNEILILGFTISTLIMTTVLLAIIRNEKRQKKTTYGVDIWSLNLEFCNFKVN